MRDDTRSRQCVSREKSFTQRVQVGEVVVIA